ncbi:hypothetical protein LTR36_000379 [Oleoguttula mirabilis]|uniref:BTB domain-containing protein n=1 Tax=Oleoguttula mirabilis TaxID=1507867 RepID=A0AAV9K1K7_9PEZI|nr:hypothetical protein LTR36_000379 [Oleoguttula mirabilis]
MEHLTKSIGSLLLDPKYSDLEIRCEGRSYNVHRAIVCSSSEVIARMCNGEFKETDTGVLDLESTGFDALTLERMLQYLYMGHYTVNAASAGVDGSEGNSAVKHVPESEAAESSQALVPISDGDDSLCTIPAVAHIFVYAIAVYYELPLLKGAALTKLREVATAIATNDFANVVRAAYTNASPEDDTLRSEVDSLALSRMDELLSCASFRSVLNETADLHAFAAHVLPAAFQQTRVQNGEAQSLKRVVEMQQKDLMMTQKALQASEGNTAKVTKRADQNVAELLTVRQSLKDKEARLDQLDLQHSRSLIQLDNEKAKICEVQKQADRYMADALTLQQSLQDERSKASKQEMQLADHRAQLNNALAKKSAAVERKGQTVQGSTRIAGEA